MVEDGSFKSDLASGLQKRLLKYRDKLFAFTKYDGIPWNNNNAENAIRHFAYYRERTVGTMKEKGLADYLVLLSLSVSCRYRGISFLKFLLSKEYDLDRYNETRRGRVGNTTIETYPKSYYIEEQLRVVTRRSKASLSRQPDG
jgi:hypothetical protein